jgi:putative ABC transport system permease protein
MLKNYFKTGLRNLSRNTSYTVINVLGLALGISCAILIFSLVKSHLSFDNFHSNSDRIYRIVTEQHRDVVDYQSSAPSPLGKAFRNDFTFSEKVARIVTFEGQLVTFQKGQELIKFKEPETAFTESEFFDIFNYPLVQGDRKSLLVQPNTAVITEHIAKKYFGEESPINKTFKLDGKTDFQITGVLKDLPQNSERQTEIYLSYLNLKDYDEWMAGDDSWGGISSQVKCFVLLREGVDPKDAEDAMVPYVKKYRPKSKNVHHYLLQPLNEIHFDGKYGGVMEKRNLWVLSLIGFFLVVTACVNFINLATAQALNRTKEVGVRKVLGSQRNQLFWQFITETGFITTIAAILSIAILNVSLPAINEWFNSRITVDLLSDTPLTLFILIVMVIVIFLAGSYPGIIIAGFKPVSALKGKISQMSIGGFNTRRSLIITQFAISQILIIGMIVITSQMNYSKKSDLGFDKDAVVMIPMATGTTTSIAHTVKTQLSQVPGVENISLCFSAPSSENNWSTTPLFDNRTEDEAFRISIKAADDNYLSTFGIELVAGRNLLPSDTVREFLVNETLAKKLNLTSAEELIGKKLTINGEVTAPIVGVVKDFHDRSFHEDINPICIPSWQDQYQIYAVKINRNNVTATLAALEKTWSGLHPDQIYEYQFLDDHIAEFYQSEDRMLKFIQAFSLIAICIGCLGLYGLVSFMAAQKTKEIGIRKVLGGSIVHILWLFGKEFSRLIALAFLIAAPIGWWVMNGWLQDFKFKIEIGAWIFLLAIGITFTIAALTVGYQAMKAALMNPARSLSSE